MMPVQEGDGRLIPVATSPEPGARPVAENGAAAGAATAATPATQQAPVLAVLDFRSNTLSTAEVAAISEAFWAQLQLTGAVRMLPRVQTRQWLISQGLHPFMPYAPSVPMSRVMESVRADYLICGTIDRIQSTYALDLAIYAAGRDQPLSTDAGARVASLDQMLLLTNALASETLTVIERHLGRRLVVYQVPGEWAQMPVATSGRLAARATESPAPASTTPKQTNASKTRVAASTKSIVETPADGGRAGAPQPSASRAQATPEPSAAPTPETVQTLPEPPAIEEPAANDVDAVATTDVGPETPAATESVAQPEPTPPATVPSAPEGSATARAQELFGQALALPNDDARRVELLEQATQLAPANAEYYQQLAFGYFHLGRYDDCAKLCDRALERLPNNAMLLMIKGSALISLGQFNDAIGACREAIAADSGSTAANYARYNLALSLEMVDSPEAVEAWSDYLEHAASDPDHQSRLDEARQRMQALQAR